MIKVGSSVCVTYADSDEQGNLINHRDYTGTVESIKRGADGKRSKANGFTSACMIVLKTDKGYRSLYHARITDIRLA